jgi:hypothetical protein
MQVDVLLEAGYEQALYGLSLSFKDRAIPRDEWWTAEKFEAMKNRSDSLYKLDGGHNKFLESIVVWLDIEGPRGWWQEFDTYRVGTTKQSESSMHTIQLRPTDQNDYETGTHVDIIKIFNKVLAEETDNFSTKKRLSGRSLQRVKDNLPEGFLQRREVCLNYKTLKNMVSQRKLHKLLYWQMFIAEIKTKLEHPNFLEV